MICMLCDTLCILRPYLRHVLAELCQGITVESQLGDDVLRHVGVDAVQAARVALGRVQQLQELLRVELEALEEARRPRDDQQQLLDQRRQVARRLRRLLAGLKAMNEC